MEQGVEQNAKAKPAGLTSKAQRTTAEAALIDAVRSLNAALNADGIGDGSRGNCLILFYCLPCPHRSTRRPLVAHAASPCRSVKPATGPRSAPSSQHHQPWHPPPSPHQPSVALPSSLTPHPLCLTVPQSDLVQRQRGCCRGNDAVDDARLQRRLHHVERGHPGAG